MQIDSSGVLGGIHHESICWYGYTDFTNNKNSGMKYIFFYGMKFILMVGTFRNEPHSWETY